MDDLDLIFAWGWLFGGVMGYLIGKLVWRRR